MPLKLGLAYTNATLATPCRGVLFFANQDLQKPRVGLLDSNAQFSALTIAGGTNGAARNQDAIQATLTAAILSSFTITAPSGGGPCTVVGADQTLAGKITAGSSKVKVG